MMVGVCPVCKRSDLVTPPQLMSATLFDLNPHLKKRLEWRQNINRNMGIPDLPFDPSKFPKLKLPKEFHDAIHTKVFHDLMTPAPNEQLKQAMPILIVVVVVAILYLVAKKMGWM